MAIPKHIIDEVKHSQRISEVLGKYISLKRHGKEYQALCPFHKEKTPSFTVSDEKGFYHCFGCGAHGDAVSFLMQHQQMSYTDAVRQLADQAGIFIPEEKPEDIEKQNYTDSLYDVMAAASRWFSQRLQAEEGWAAREYINKRGLDSQTVTRFMLGFAPSERSGLKTHLHDLGYSEQQMLDVGLLTKPDNGSSYDKFRSRLMFPIVNASGKVIAFGGRLISDDLDSRAPKYLNSPETVLFHKRTQFYTVPDTSKHKTRLIVVEGYMDVIACVQAGIEEVVATLGTAFTEDHAKQLWRAVDEPVLCLDGDNAGSRAMLRAAELAIPLLQAGKSLRFMLMPQGDDPDTLLKRQGKAAFEQLVNKAMPLHEAIFNAYSTGIDMRDPMKRAGLEKQLAQLAGQVTEPTLRQHLQRYFKDAMWQAGRAAPHQKHAAKPRPAAVTIQSDPLDKLNRLVLKLLISHPLLLEIPLAEELLMRIDSHASKLDDLKSALQHYMHEETSESLVDYVRMKDSAEIFEQLLADTSLIIPTIVPEDSAQCEQMLRQWFDQLDRMNVEKEYQELTKSIHNHEASDEMLERMLLLQQEIQMRKTSAPV